jgi:hypothetical protein
MRLRRSAGTGMLLMVLLAATADARTATLRVQARLRQGATAASELLGWIAAGTRVEVLADEGGWRRVQTPDGRTGFMWGEHLVEGEAPPAATDAAAPATPRPAEEAGVAPATAADLERVRAELERLAAAQRDLARHLAERPPTAAGLPAVVAPVPVDTAAGVVPLVFGIGAAVGFAASWVLHRRRDRRQWTRLRV